MEIHTLKNLDPDELLIAFNESFSDYFVPLQLTKEQLENKLKSENFDPELSAGAFKNGKLCGFILHCIDSTDNRNRVYNAGTGVIPRERSQGLTKRMYDFILPALVNANIDAVVLEVITANIPAIKTYKKAGFKIIRKLVCYRGDLNAEKNESITLKELPGYDWEQLKSFWDFTPAWQNSVSVLERLKSSNISYGAYIEDQLAGYIAYNPSGKRVQQFGVEKKHRRKNIASTLFSHVNPPGSSLTVINVDENAVATNAFLKAAGLKPFIEQFEMQLDMKDRN